MSIKLRLYTWKKYGWLTKLNGIDLDDIAQQAIVDTFSGQRRWPPIDAATGIEKPDVTLFYFLCQTVRSIVSHQGQGPRPVDFDRIDPRSDGPQYENAYAGTSAPFLVRPADIERAAEYNNLTDKMLELTSGDSDLSRIVRLWRACPDLKPREIAEELQFTMPEVRAAQKRLKRLLDVLRRKEDE
ncbi:MAG: hypothetical protein AABN95_12850 [Acidobacteriota bacterium]